MGTRERVGGSIYVSERPLSILYEVTTGVRLGKMTVEVLADCGSILNIHVEVSATKKKKKN